MAINVQLPDYNNSEGQIFSLRVVNATSTTGHDDRWEYLEREVLIQRDQVST